MLKNSQLFTRKKRKIFRVLCLYEFEYKENSQAISMSLYKKQINFNAFFYRRTTQKLVRTKINTYKDLHAFTYIFLIKACITDLILKNKNTILQSCL